MPTGYTAGIEKGNITFTQFALLCARAFGACVDMRDAPLTESIPKKFKPSTYHKIQLAKALGDLTKLQGLSTLQIQKQAKVEITAEIRRCNKYITERKRLAVKYTNLLEQVYRWTPPTPEHEGLKSFMIQQLQDSKNSDCRNIYWEDRLKKLRGTTAEDWYIQKVKDAKWAVDYHTRQDAEEVQRCEDRSRWVAQLRKSLT